jgi:hypothetical protein
MALKNAMRWGTGKNMEGHKDKNEVLAAVNHEMMTPAPRCFVY